VIDVSLGENFILETSGKEPVSKHGILNFNNIRNTSKQLIKDYDIRCISVDQTAATLSGGNQQKLVLAREFSRMPKFIIAMQPSRGLDVGATEFVHEKLLEQRENGNGILLISTELDEIFELSDRISVIYEGKILATLSREVANRERIGLLMTGKTDV
jgi:simple sugar transport system ATP-binding protein